MYSYYGLAELKIGHFVVVLKQIVQNNLKVNTLKSTSKFYHSSFII